MFISHSNKDWNLVQQLQQWLRSIGFNPILAKTTFEPKYVHEKVKRQIDSADVVIVVWTRNAKESAFVNQEIGYAFQNKPIIIIIKAENIPLSGFAYDLDVIDLVADDYSLEVGKLRKYLPHLIGRETCMLFLVVLQWWLRLVWESYY